MVTGVSVLTRLETLSIAFDSPRNPPNRRSRCPPPTRTLLPVLTKLQFYGVDEYLEDLVARIDVPLLKKLDITFFYHGQLIFATPQLIHFISRTPKFKPHDNASVDLSDWEVGVTLPQTFSGRLTLGIEARSDW
jgi:hypothetical protein